MVQNRPKACKKRVKNKKDENHWGGACHKTSDDKVSQLRETRELDVRVLECKDKNFVPLPRS